MMRLRRIIKLIIISVIFVFLYYIAFGIGLKVLINPCNFLQGERYLAPDGSISYRKICLDITAKLFANSDLCIDRNDYGGCISTIAVKKRSPLICEQVIDPSSRDWCMLKVANKTKDQNICFKIVDWTIARGVCWAILVGEFGREGQNRLVGTLDEIDYSCQRGGNQCRIRMDSSWILVADRNIDQHYSNNVDGDYRDGESRLGIPLYTGNIGKEIHVIARRLGENSYSLYPEILPDRKNTGVLRKFQGQFCYEIEGNTCK